MRVLHINSGNLYGGVEALLVTLALHRHSAEAMDPHFAVCFDGRLEEELRQAGVAVHRLPEARTSRPWTILETRRALGRLLEEQSFDVVLCHMPWSLAMFGSTVRSKGLPLAFWIHDIPDGRHWLQRWAKRTEPDLAIVNSRFTGRAAGLLFPGLEPVVVYPPVPEPPPAIDSRAAVRAELETSPEDAVIIQVSRMEAWKGHQLHLEALARLRDLPGWTCWFVGGSQREAERVYVEALRRQAEEAGIAGRVRFCGQRSDVRRLLQAADIHCQPNAGPEPFGITFIEALWAGLPVVATAMGGAAEIVTEECGILTRPADAADLERALRLLIGDPGKRRALGGNGPARARFLSDPGGNTFALYRHLSRIARGNPAPATDGAVTPGVTR